MSHLAARAQPNPLMVDWAELVIGAVAFLIVFAVLSKVLLPRITRTLEERADAIDGGLNRAGQAQAEAARVLAEYQAQVAEARHEAARLREAAREQGALHIAEMREQGQAEAHQIIAGAQAELAAERQQALITLRTHVGDIGVELASRAVGEPLQDEARQRQMVERFLAELEPGPAKSPKHQQLAKHDAGSSGNGMSVACPMRRPARDTHGRSAGNNPLYHPEHGDFSLTEGSSWGTRGRSRTDRRERSPR